MLTWCKVDEGCSSGIAEPPFVVELEGPALVPESRLEWELAAVSFAFLAW